MLWLYRLLFLPVLIFSAPIYLRRMLGRGGYQRNFRHRFGLVPHLEPVPKGKHRVWIHAVSVGEILALEPLFEVLRGEKNLEIILSTTTSTGYVVAEHRYRSIYAHLIYFPLDFWWCSVLAWRRLEPQMAVLTESELWPEHMHQAQKRRIPLFLINARLSDRTYARLLKGGYLVSGFFDPLTKILAASKEDAARFRGLGVENEKISVSGNLKLDLRLASRLDSGGRSRLMAELGLDQDIAVLLGASTWPGEEEALIEVLHRLRGEGHAAQLLIVPRHAERRTELEPLLEASGLKYHFRSQGASPRPVDVCVADTTGELRSLLQLAAVVFIGKSLPPNQGGQTPVEAAAWGKPLVFGPHMENFRAITRELLSVEACLRVGDRDSLVSTLLSLWADRERQHRMGKAGIAWQKANQGAAERTVQALRKGWRTPGAKKNRA